jgi:O-antigen/teichoic acid export membrane protein
VSDTAIHIETRNIIGSGRGFAAFGFFVFTIVFARTLGPAGFGSFRQIYIFSALFMILSSGLPDTLPYFLLKLDDSDRSAFIGRTLLLMSAIGMCAGLLVWFGAPALAEIQGNPKIAPTLRIFGLYGACFIVNAFFNPVFIVYGKINYVFILNLLGGVFYIALSVWQVVSPLSVVMLISALTVFSVLRCCFSGFLFVNMKPLETRALFGRVKYSILLQLVIAAPVALAYTADILSQWADKIVVSVFLGPELFGIYSAAAVEIPFATVIIATVYGVAIPKLNALHRENAYGELAALLKKSAAFAAKIVWPICIYLLIFADHAIGLLFTREFEQAVVPFRLYLAMMPAAIISASAVTGVIGRPRVLIGMYLGLLAANVVVSIALVERFGLVGPAAATVVLVYARAAALIWYVRSKLDIPTGEILPFRPLGDTALAGLLSGAISFILTRGYRGDAKTVLMSLTIFTGAYIFIGAKLKLFKVLSVTELMGGDLVGKKD